MGNELTARENRFLLRVIVSLHDGLGRGDGEPKCVSESGDTKSIFVD